MKREFHDLAESALNQESGGATHWGNLGDWRRARTYPDACAALADRVANGVALRASTRLIDVGFGCGDQLLRWIEHHGCLDIAGLNLSQSQTELARRRLVERGHADQAAHLEQGSAQNLDAWAAREGRAPVDAVVALDCAYHFTSRRAFLHAAARMLRPGGRLALTDLVLARRDLPWRARALLLAMSAASRIPGENWVDEATYREHWRQAGFVIDGFDDISGDVFQPFGEWLTRYRASLDPATARGVNWTKYRATAAFLRWAGRERVLRYVVCSGSRAQG